MTVSSVRWARIARRLVVLSGLLVPAVAFGQTPGESPSSDEEYDQAEMGVKLSEELYFHPSVGVGTGYQSNVFYTSEDDNEGVDSSAMLRLGIGLQVATRDQTDGRQTDGVATPKISFYTDLDLTWNQYLSNEEHVQDQSDLGVAGIMNLVVNPKGTVRINFRDTFVRAVTPPRIATADNIDRDRNDVMVGLDWVPGGGALRTSLTYSFTVDVFERSELEFGNRLSHRVAIGGVWQWLPRTSFDTEASVAFVDPDDANPLTSASTHFQYWLGTTTLITPTVGTVLRFGYGNGSYNTGPDLNTYIARAEIRWAYTNRLRLAGGYDRAFQDSIIANFHSDHKLYVKSVTRLARALQLSVSGDVVFRSYEYNDEMGPVRLGGLYFCADDVCADSDREDTIIDATARLEYTVVRYLYATLEYTYSKDITDFLARPGDSGTASMFEDHGSYTWHQVLLTAEARY